MMLRIFIAIIALDASHVHSALVERDPLLTRKAHTNAEVERVTPASWSVWSVVSSAYNMVTHIVPTPEEVLREKLKGIVFPDGRDAAGELVSGYRCSVATELYSTDNNLAVLDVHDTLCNTDNPEVYATALRIVVDYAARGQSNALSCLALLFSTTEPVYRLTWPYRNPDRATLFRQAEEPIRISAGHLEVTNEALRQMCGQGRSRTSPYDNEQKKEK